MSTSAIVYLRIAWRKLTSLSAGIVSLLLLLAIGCVTEKTPKNQVPPAAAAVPGFSREEVASEARQDASKAILGGQLYICDAGTIAIYSPGITPENRELVSDLPHCLLPAGCTDPRAFRSIYYAQIFNSEIVRYLAANPPETQ